jgi:CRP-like cAMP-binding protein
VSSGAESLLAQANLFRGLGDGDIERLTHAAVSHRYKKGSAVIYEGDPGDALYVVMSGSLKVFVTSSEGNELLLTTLSSGDTFGELALIDGGTRSASVEALEASELLVLTRPSLLEILADYPSVTEALLTNLGKTIRRVSEQAADLVFLDLDGRVAKLLVQLAEESPAAGETSTIDLGMSQSDLAAHIGGSRQSVNQSLHRFAKRGYLTLDKRMVAVKDLARLRRRAGM